MFRGALKTGLFAILLTTAGSALAGNWLEKGTTEYRSQNYTRAIKSFRKHLRRHPGDYATWNYLGASYLYSGRPQKSLKILRRFLPKTRLQSFNLYHQGLSHKILDKPAAAERLLIQASRFSDEYGSRANFELAILAWQAGQTKKARRRANAYLKRPGSAIYRKKAQKLLQSIRKGVYTPDLRGAPLPDKETALYNYSNLSLLKGKPHFWFVRLGYAYDQGYVINPDRERKLKKEPFVVHELETQAGIGYGPIKQKDSTISFGYRYSQDWGADNDRILTWMDDPGDLEYFAFRPDLMERRHQVFGEFEKKFGGGFSFGLLGIYDKGRVGSGIYPGPDDQVLTQVLDSTTDTLLIPWISMQYMRNLWKTSFYLYMRKELNQEEPDFSNKSYNITDPNTDKLVSFGLNHEISFPTRQMQVAVELFKHEYVFNDNWLDYVRTGGIATVHKRIQNGFYVEVKVGMYTDAYVLPRLRAGTCSFSGQGSTVSNAIIECPRDDKATLYDIGGGWNLNPFSKFSLTYEHLQYKNASMEIFEQNRDRFLFYYTVAFPGTRQTSQRTRRYDRGIFSKKVD